MKLPQFFILGLEAIKFVETEDGGMAVEVFDIDRNCFVPEAEIGASVSYYAEVLKPGADVEEFDDEEEFERAFEEVKQEVKELRRQGLALKKL